MRTGGEEARRHQPSVVGGEGTEHLGEGEQHHDADQYGALGEAGGENGEGGTADGHADRIGGDQQASRWNGDGEVLGERRQYA